MASHFVKTMKEHNLCTWFLLPLIQLNKFSFGGSNFINSYVNHEGTILCIELVDLRLCPSFSTHPEYIREQEAGEYSYIWFHLPHNWQSDFKLFRRGKYSMFSDNAKHMIITYSGLHYRQGDQTGNSFTDARLLALDRSSILRDKWTEELGLNERGNAPIPEDLELLSVPDSNTFREFD